MNEQPEMSEIATVGNIFFEPERTFKDLRRKPRFIIAGIIIALFVTAYTFAISIKVGEDVIRRATAEAIDQRAPNLDKDQKEAQVNISMKINGYVRYAVPIFVFISFFIGGLLYWAGAKAFGGTGTFMQNVSVWVYAGLAPAVIAMTANLIVLMMKSADDIDLAASQRGLIHANPSFFIDGKAHNFLATFLSTFDVFAIWGWILAAIGLSVVNKMSKGAAWTLVIIIVVIGLGFRLVGTMFSGNPN